MADIRIEECPTCGSQDPDCTKVSFEGGDDAEIESVDLRPAMRCTDPFHGEAVQTQDEKDCELGRTVREADVVILLTKAGQAGVAYFNHLGRVPHTVEVSYGESDDPPSTIRQVKVNAGWPRAKWRKMDRSGLHESEEESPHPNTPRAES